MNTSEANQTVIDYVMAGYFMMTTDFRHRIYWITDADYTSFRIGNTGQVLPLTEHMKDVIAGCIRLGIQPSDYYNQQFNITLIGE